jgi:hypothetical protein
MMLSRRHVPSRDVAGGEMEIAAMWDSALAIAACLGGAWAGARGVRLLTRGIRRSGEPEAPLWVIRGLRGIIGAICGAAAAGGLVFQQPWLLVFAGLWLAEEIYETGVLALILRAGLRADMPPRGTTTTDSAGGAG